MLLFPQNVACLPPQAWIADASPPLPLRAPPAGVGPRWPALASCSPRAPQRRSLTLAFRGLTLPGHERPGIVPFTVAHPRPCSRHPCRSQMGWAGAPPPPLTEPQQPQPDEDLAWQSTTPSRRAYPPALVDAIEGASKNPWTKLPLDKAHALRQ